MADIRYSIKYNRMKNAFIEGFEATEDGRLISVAALHNHVFFKPIDTAVLDNKFGRLCFDVKIDGEVYMIYMSQLLMNI